MILVLLVWFKFIKYIPSENNWKVFLGSSLGLAWFEPALRWQITTYILLGYVFSTYSRLQLIYHVLVHFNSRLVGPVYY